MNGRHDIPFADWLLLQHQRKDEVGLLARRLRGVRNYPRGGRTKESVLLWFARNAPDYYPGGADAAWDEYTGGTL